MSNDSSSATPEITAAFLNYDRDVTVSNIRVGCMLGIVLMPAGALLDNFVYHDELGYFLKLRLLCSALILIFWFIVSSRFGRRHHREFGVILAMIPASFMSWMIYATDGSASPYYAGLNLVLLVVGFVLHWTFMESFVAVGLTMVMYLTACYFSQAATNLGIFFNNLYFLSLSGIIMATGSYFHSRLRFREFALRHQLDENRRQLEDSNQKLKELDQIKGRFFANISHELRTPLTLMISPLETIMGRYSNALGPDAVGLLKTMHGNGLRLLKLINDLLDLVRLDSGVMQARREPVALEQLLNGMASAARQVAEDKKIDLVVAIAPDVGVAMLDRDKLEKIVLNLQFNALKFTPAGGRVELRAAKEGDELVLRVVDNGIGIPEKDLPNVFGRFFQVDSSARRKYQGVGIGLALVKELVELHDGTVSVHSVEGKGTTFTARMPFVVPEPGAVPVVTTPLEVSPAPAAPGGTASTADGKTEGTVSSQEWLTNLYQRANLFGAPVLDRVAPAKSAANAPGNEHESTVLIADDQPDMLMFLKSELAAHYNVITVVNGQQAVDAAAEFHPDIILLDMMMPEKDGIQACREIRAEAATRNTPIVLITAHVDEDTKLNALRAGASDFLPKPFSTTELHVRVKNLVESHGFQRKLADQNHQLETAIEQLKDTETQLVQTEKIAALGRLSAGIIHEINNPLNFAATGLYTLRSKAKLIPDTDRDGYAEVLKDVEEGIHRVKSIVSDLRTFTHPGSRGIEEVNAQEAVVSALRFLSQEWKNKVELRVDLSDAQVVLADKNKVIQVLINLLQNSLDAIRTKKYESGKPEIVISGEVVREVSRLMIRDNGGGITPEVMDKIFDPFFTTKDVGEGMGLGLSICYRIMKDFGGRITARSEPGVFCEFTLEFPAVQPQAALQP